MKLTAGATEALIDGSQMVLCIGFLVLISPILLPIIAISLLVACINAAYTQTWGMEREWHPWFAWHPVVADGRLTWWEWVERREDDCDGEILYRASAGHKALESDQ